MNKKKWFFRLIVAIFLSKLMSALTFAAHRTYLWDHNDKLLLISEATGFNVKESPRQLLQLRANHSLQARKQYVERNGDTTIRYQQLFKGVPILGDDVILAFYADGRFKRAHGSIVRGIDAQLIDVTPALSSREALHRAKLLSAASDQQMLLHDAMAIGHDAESVRLAIWQDTQGAARLVYEVSFTRHAGIPSRPYYILDALTGQQLDYFDSLQRAHATGAGGNEKVGRHEYGIDRPSLQVSQSGTSCTMDNDHVKTVDLAHATAGFTAHRFTCPRNNHKPINGGHGPLNDAHYAGTVVSLMYKQWLGQPPLPNKIVINVHYGINQDNAFWSGGEVSIGDGYRSYYPLVSLDVVAHEVSHGYTEYHSALAYRNQAGGLNEAFSDMAGEAAEYYANNTVDWMVGASITKGAGRALRYMDEPTRQPGAIDHLSQYTDGMSSHYSSGVYNKAFYRLATTPGWTVKKAFQVYAKANQHYWSRSTDWVRAGHGVIDAACDLGYNILDVKMSLAHVGIESNASTGSVCVGEPAS